MRRNVQVPIWDGISEFGETMLELEAVCARATDEQRKQRASFSSAKYNGPEAWD
jgi:hypothetical protein